MKLRKTTATLLIAIFMISIFAVAIPLASAYEGEYAVDRYSSTMEWEGTYTTILAAITGASSGDIIIVDAGTYAENVQVPPNIADLQLIGASSSSTFIAPTSGRPVTLLGWVGPIVGFKLQGFTLKTADHLHAFLAGSGTNDGTTYTTDLELEDIVVDGGQRGIGLNALAGAIFTNVHLSNIRGSDEAALELTGVSDLVFTGGSFEDNDIGVRLQPTGTGDIGDGYGPNGNIQIHTSSFAGNDMAIENQDSGTTIDATLNWWGSVRGPSRAIGKAKGHEDVKGDRISPNVRFAPWLKEAVFGLE